MFLLMASVHPGCVLWTLAIIFFLHVVFDVLTIREDVASYDHALAGVNEPSAAQIWDVYAGGFAGKAQIQPGPVITLAWTIYFVLLAVIANGRADAHVRTACFFALVGLVGYRLAEGPPAALPARSRPPARPQRRHAQARPRGRRRLDCGRDLFPSAGRRVGATSALPSPRMTPGLKAELHNASNAGEICLEPLADGPCTNRKSP